MKNTLFPDLNKYFNIYVCLSIRSFVHLSVWVSENDLQFL